MLAPCIAPLRHARQLTRDWNRADVLAWPHQTASAYLLGLASSDACVEQAQRLRYEVFNVELNEGLAEAHLTGLDRDCFDHQMSHLVLLDRASLRVVGTYRLQTGYHALAGEGFYSAQEYDLRPLEPRFESLVECGRACVAAEHRTLPAIQALWHGIRSYTQLFGQRWLFGCCSLTSQDPADGWRAWQTLAARGWLHPSLRLEPVAACSCGPCPPADDGRDDERGGFTLPKLFNAYMRMGARVVSQPAIDRAFGTIDFLVLMDTLVCTEKACAPALAPSASVPLLATA